MACASGCSLPWSGLRPSAEPRPSRTARFPLHYEGRPPLRQCPVLSTIKVSILQRFSIALASRNNTPLLAALPVATMTDIGVAKPRAHGRAMIGTATALIRPNTQPDSGPNTPSQKCQDRDQDHPHHEVPCHGIGHTLHGRLGTLGLSHHLDDLRQHGFGAHLLRFHHQAAVGVRVAPMRVSPARLVTGTGSPVSIDSSTALSPSSTVPSTGTFRPAGHASGHPDGRGSAEYLLPGRQA